MLDVLCGDEGGANPITFAVIAIVAAVLLFGGCASAECGDCCIDRSAKQTAK